MKNFYRIADLHYARSATDATYTFDWEGKHFEVQRFGANFSVPYLLDRMKSLSQKVDAISVSGLPSALHFKGKSFVHPDTLEVMSQPLSIPLCDGARLYELITVNALSNAIRDGLIRPEEGMFFPVGLLYLDAISSLIKKYKKYLVFGDPVSLLGLPFLMNAHWGSEHLTPLAIQMASLRKMKGQTPYARPQSVLNQYAMNELKKKIKNTRYIIADIELLTLFGKDLDFIRGKDLVGFSYPPALRAEIEKFEPRSVLNLFPKELQFSAHSSYAATDAVLRLSNQQSSPLSLQEWEKLLSKSIKINPEAKRFFFRTKNSVQMGFSHAIYRTRSKLSKQAPPDFAFVVHSLSVNDIFRVPGLRLLRNTPDSFKGVVEENFSKLPGIQYGRIQNIVSQRNGRVVNGLIYALFSTPKMMKQEPVEKTYKKILSICEDASSRGAKLMGLGAYTKIVGDSGATINRHSPIPVTTGNSLSASATLWALHDVLNEMNLIPKDPSTGLLDGMATVIGATGSIGKVSAKLLSLVFKRLCIVAPKKDRLEELAVEIRKLSPHCEVFTTTDANDFGPQSDALITATSAFDQKIIDIMRIKPGCVVCDCSRPLDFTIEDAMLRPDIIIIESGEVLLPGNVDISCDLGLPGKDVYACLGETALLAMEGLYEPYTLGRDIDWQKVKGIYQMAQQHGVKLAAIRGHAGLVTKREIQLARLQALTARSSI